MTSFLARRTRVDSRVPRLIVWIFAAALLACAQQASATSICRWVDNAGRTQVSDAVPEKYRKSAHCTESKQYDVSPEAMKRAQERAAKDKLAAQNAGRRAPAASAPSAAWAASAPPAAKRPAQTVTDTTDCATWRRLYQESLECFGPYRTTRGATKPEAFEKCNPVPSPDDKCGAIIQ